MCITRETIFSHLHCQLKSKLPLSVYENFNLGQWCQMALVVRISRCKIIILTSPLMLLLVWIDRAVIDVWLSFRPARICGWEENVEGTDMWDLKYMLEIHEGKSINETSKS